MNEIDEFDAEDRTTCPGCGYYRRVMHAGDLRAPEGAPEYPCDGSFYRARVDATRAEMIAQYEVGARVSGFHHYAAQEGVEYIVTRAQIATKRPSWHKGTEHSVNWERLWRDGWGHDVAVLPTLPIDDDRDDWQRRPGIYFEFKRADIIEQPSLFSGAA